MSSLPTSLIATPSRQHRRLLTEVSPGHYELCIDNTTLEKMLTCPRSFELYAVYGRDTLKKDALNYGSALHHALELFYLADDQSDPDLLGRMQDKVMQHFAANPCSYDEWRNADHALEAVRRYVNWRKQCPVWTPIIHEGRKMVEVPFKLTLTEHRPKVNPMAFLGAYDYDLICTTELSREERATATEYVITIYWTGKIDLVIRKDGMLWPIDHKTTSVEGATFYQSFLLSSQLMGYSWACQQLLGEPVAGAIVDALIGRRPTERGKGIPYENKAFPVDFTQAQLAEWKRDTCEHVDTLLSRLFKGYFPKQTAWCVGKYGLCPYHDVCTMSPAAQPAILMSGQYTERTWNPLDSDNPTATQPT